MANDASGKKYENFEETASRKAGEICLRIIDENELQ
jgi:hypothetical protein